MEKSNSIMLLCEITKLVNSSNSPEHVFSAVADRCVEYLRLEKVFIYPCECNKEIENDFIDPNEGYNKCGDEKSQTCTFSELRHKNNVMMSVPVIWKQKMYGHITSQFSKHSNTHESDKRLFSIIASLLTPKFIELHKPERAFKKDNRHYCELIRLLEREKLYMDENLSLGSIARRLNISKSYLSQIINKLGKKSFNTMINDYRIRDVVCAFKDGKHLKYSILAIAYDAGFSSKSTFNAVFKNALGCSPTEYIQNACLKLLTVKNSGRSN